MRQTRLRRRSVPPPHAALRHPNPSCSSSALTSLSHTSASGLTGNTPNGSSICTPISSMPSIMYVTRNCAGTDAHPIVGHSANGSVNSHSISDLDVCRVYDMGIGVLCILSAPPTIFPISDTNSSAW